MRTKNSAMSWSLARAGKNVGGIEFTLRNPPNFLLLIVSELWLFSRIDFQK